MDTTAIIAIVIGAVIVLAIVVLRFNVVNIRGKVGDKEASIVASQHPPTPAAAPTGTGAVSIGGSASAATVQTDVTGAQDPGAGSVTTAGDATGAVIGTKVRQGRDAD